MILQMCHNKSSQSERDISRFSKWALQSFNKDITRDPLVSDVTNEGNKDIQIHNNPSTTEETVNEKVLKVGMAVLLLKALNYHNQPDSICYIILFFC